MSSAAQIKAKRTAKYTDIVNKKAGYMMAKNVADFGEASSYVGQDPFFAKSDITQTGALSHHGFAPFHILRLTVDLLV